MNSEHVHHHPPAQAHAALIDAAKARSTALRDEAIGAFWSKVGQTIRDAWHTLRHRRLAASTHHPRSTSTCPR